jgi:hypothetical protein
MEELQIMPSYCDLSILWRMQLRIINEGGGRKVAQFSQRMQCSAKNQPTSKNDAKKDSNQTRTTTTSKIKLKFSIGKNAFYGHVKGRNSCIPILCSIRE